MNGAPLFTDLVSRHLAMTLLHFLWQGAAIAVAVGAGSWILRRNTPKERYAVSLAGLGAMVLCPLLSYAMVSQDPSSSPTSELPASAPDVARPDSFVPAAGDRVVANAWTPGEPARSTSFESAQVWIVPVWLLGVVILSLRMLLGAIWLHRLKRRAGALSSEFVATVAAMCQALELRPVRVGTSADLGEALAMGLFRPLVLVPVSWLTELPPDMVRAVLAHELAHLRRHDLWINLAQRVVETLLFYHPAVWWLSRRLRIDRELCCDELAVTVTGDRFRYAQTLEHVGRLMLGREATSFALSIGGSRMFLLQRVRHVLGLTPSKSPTMLPWLAGTLLLLGFGAVCWLAVSETLPTVEGQQPAKKDAEVTGTVVDASEKPVPRAQVEVFKRGYREKVLTADANGEFRVPMAWRTKEIEGYRLIVRSEGRIGWFDFYRSSQIKTTQEPFRVTVFPLGRTIRGHITDQDGKPLAEVPVKVSDLFHKANFSVWIWPEEGLIAPGKTDAQGRFTLKVPAGSEGTVRAHHPDWQSNWLSWSDQKDDIDTAKLAPGGRIEGRVLDAETGKPIAGAHAAAQAYHRDSIGGYGEALSDETGRFVIGGLSPGQYNALFGPVPGRENLTAVATEAVVVKVGQPANVDFQVRPGRVVSGKVIDAATGKPLTGISVGYYGTSHPRSGAACIMHRTDAEGKFVFHVPPGTSYFYVADGSRSSVDDSSRTFEVPATGELDPFVLKAGPVRDTRGEKKTVEIKKTKEDDTSFRLHGVFRTPDARPVKGVELHLMFVGDPPMAQNVMHKAGNSFHHDFREQAAGHRYFFYVEADGFAFTKSPEFQVAKQMPVLTIDLQPAVHVPISGCVVDRQGKPVAGARVSTGWIVYKSNTKFPWGTEVSTDARGRYELKQLRVGDRFYLRIDLEGTGGAETEPLLLKDATPMTMPVQQVGPPDATVEGDVFADHGEPVPGAKVYLRTDPERHTFTDAKGHFQLDGLPAGKVPLSVSAPGYREEHSGGFPKAGSMDARLYAERLPSADAELYRQKLELRPKDGKIVPSGVIWFIDDEKDRGMGWTGGGNDSNDYSFNLHENRGIPEGRRITFVVDAKGYAQSKPVSIVVRKNPEPIVVELEAAAPVKLRGRVVDAAGVPVVGAKVGLSRGITERVNDEEWRWFRMPSKIARAPETDAQGRFELNGIIPGSRTAVLVDKLGYAGVWSPRALVETGKPINLPDLKLEKATREIAGRVVDERGSPVAGAKVVASSLIRIESVTAKNGSFRLAGLPDHVMGIYVDAPDFAQWGDYVNRDTKTLEIKLKRE